MNPFRRTLVALGPVVLILVVPLAAQVRAIGPYIDPAATAALYAPRAARSR